MPSLWSLKDALLDSWGMDARDLLDEIFNAVGEMADDETAQNIRACLEDIMKEYEDCNR